MQISHGGKLSLAAQRFSIPLDQWIDLSTGISPWSWPVPTLAAKLWRNLPEQDDALEFAAADYFLCSRRDLLALPGSQYAIQHIPQMIETSSVAIPCCGYREHFKAWKAAGHTLLHYQGLKELQNLLSSEQIKYAVIVNPNNPTAELLPPKAVLKIAKRLSQEGGFLLIDEAFVDATPEYSISSFSNEPGILVLRSIGKFFGLAGIRLGFVLGANKLRERLEASMPTWPIATPTRWIGEQALTDSLWQQQQLARIKASLPAWLELLQQAYPEFVFKANPLFVTGFADSSYCNSIYLDLANKGILVRLFTESEGLSAIRFGLADSSQFEQFKNRLKI